MKKLLILATLFLFSNLLPANAITVDNSKTLIDYNDTWNYYQVSGSDYNWLSDNGWDTAGYESFNWSNVLNNSGQGAFGSQLGSDATVKTYWSVNTGLALQKDFYLNGNLENAYISYGADNGAIIFVNGQQVSKLMEEGYGTQYEHGFNVASSFFVNGKNTISVLAEDHGGSTYFDLKLTGEPVPTPEPSSIILGLLSFGGLFGIKRRKD
jgi:hypothetical protein